MARCKFHVSLCTRFIFDFTCGNFLIGVLLLSIADGHPVSSSISGVNNKPDSSPVWITEDLPVSPVENESMSVGMKNESSTSQLLEMLIQLYNETLSEEGEIRTYSSENGDFLTVKIDMFNNHPLREEMQSDQPANVSSSPKESYHFNKSVNKTEFQILNEAAKEKRLHEIKIQILMFTGHMNGTDFPGEPLRKKAPRSTGLMKTLSYRPSCTVPDNVKSVWSNNGDKNMYVYFDINFQDQEVSTLNVTEARLRLYKLPMRITSSGSYIFDNTSTVDARSNQSKIHVKIYMLGMIKDKKDNVLLRKFPLRAPEENLTITDIKQAVNAWRDDKEKNFGIMIEVENGKLGAQQFFKKVDCSENFGPTIPVNLLDPNNLQENMKSVLLDVKFEQFLTESSSTMQGPYRKRGGPRNRQLRDGGN